MFKNFIPILILCAFLPHCSFVEDNFLKPVADRNSFDRVSQKIKGNGDGLSDIPNKTGDPRDPATDAFGNPVTTVFSGKKSVGWKRYQAISSTLSSALSLPEGDLCDELDKYSCIDDVHLTFFGGNEPFDLAQYSQLPDPAILTSLSLDRVVLSACTKRIEQDRAGPANVFTNFPLDSTTPSDAQIPSSPLVTLRPEDAPFSHAAS